MTTVIPTDRALAELKAFSRKHPRALTIRHHRRPDGSGNGWLWVQAVTWEARKLVREVVSRHGEARWERGRWHIARPQLAFPGFL